MSNRRSRSHEDDGEMMRTCKAVYLSIFDDITDSITDKDQLMQALQQTGRNPTSKVLAKYWTRRTDSLSFDDFVDICRKEPITTADDLMKAFHKIDINGDGYISVDELFKIMTTKGEKLSKDDVRQMIDEVDENKDGRLDYGEFCQMMLKTTEDCKKMSLKMMDRREKKGLKGGRFGDSNSSRFNHDDMPRPSPRTRKEKPTSGAAAKGKLQEPRNLREWSHKMSRGCFFFEEEEIVSHIYKLNLTEDSSVWMTIQPENVSDLGCPVDTGLFVLRSTGINKFDLVTFTEQRDSRGKYGVRCDLSAGRYHLVPFTTGCRFKQRKSQPRKEAELIKKDKDGTIVITRAFRKALEDIFELCDLDKNGLMSREEFNWFNVRTSGEKVEDDEWDVVEERIELVKGEITKTGFIRLNEMEAEECEEDTDDLWVTLSSMGYNKALEMDEACPFQLDIYAEECRNMELRIIGVDTLSEKLDTSLCQSIIDKGEVTKVKGMKDLFLHTYTSDTRTSIVVENKSKSYVNIELDCSKSRNCVSSKSGMRISTEIGPQTTEVVVHLMPEDDTHDWSPSWTESIK